MDVFKKCENISYIKAYQEQGLYPYFHALQSRQDVEVRMEGKRRIMLGSNNYLGLTTVPEVVEAARQALEKYGNGCSGPRFLNGTLEMHIELEQELADFLRKDAAMTFSTGFQANLGAISALDGLGDYTYTPQNTLEKARAAYDAGVYCNPVLLPACPEGQCLLRTSLMATHTKALADEAADILAEVMRKNG